MDRLKRILRRASAFAETRWGTVTAFVLALAVWWVQAIAMPLAGGRDFGTYVGAFIELFQAQPIDLGYVLGRTPVAPLVTGALLDPFGGALAEPGMSMLYAGSVLAWFLAARRFGGGSALLTLVLLLAYPSYGILFHELASDSVFAAGFAGWSLLTVRVLDRPSTSGFVVQGLATAVVALIRPLNQALVLVALFPLVLAVPWRRRLTWVVAVVTPAVLVLGAWTVHNGARYGDYTVSNAGNTNWPIYRVYLYDKLVRPDNGPASRKLARAVQEDLLPYEPYKSYGITLDRFFADPTPRMHNDLSALAERRWGRQSDHKILRDVAFEAIRTHPAEYAHDVAATIWGLLRDPVYRPLGASDQGSGGDDGEGGSGTGGPTIVVDGRVLPRPSEGEAIPAPRDGGPTTPHGIVRTVWTSPYEHHLVFDYPEDKRHLDALYRRMAEVGSGLPSRSGNATLTTRLNQLSRWFPPPVLWLAIGLVALVVRRPERILVLSAPAITAGFVVVLSALGLPTIPHFSVPVLPAFALLMAGALLGPRRRST